MSTATGPTESKAVLFTCPACEEPVTLTAHLGPITMGRFTLGDRAEVPLSATVLGIHVAHDCTRRPTEGEPPHCPAHGAARCAQCCRTANPGPGREPWIDSDGSCRGCSYYATTGMHWDTCPARVR